MDLRVATLCDFAQVREGLLTIASGGITRVWRNQYPNQCGLMVAMAVELSAAEANEPYEVRVRLEGADGQRHAEFSAGFQTTPGPNTDAGEMIVVPMVADLRSAKLPAAGRYQVVIDPIADGMVEAALGFRADFHRPKN